MAIARKEAITTDSRTGRENVFKEDRPDLPIKSNGKKMLFVSPVKKQGFKVPVRDENGKIMMQMKPGTNMPQLINGKPIPVLRDCNFLTQSHNVKRGCLSYYETDDKEEIETLLKLADDESNEIMTEETYLQKKDPVAYTLQKDIEKKDQEIDKLKESGKLYNEIIADLENKIKELSKGK